MKKGKISLLLGLLGGTALGILFAPQKGQELRKNIRKERERGGSGIETVKKGFEKMGREIQEECSEMYQSENIRAGIEMGKEKILDLTNIAKEEFGSAKELTAKKMAHLKSRAEKMKKEKEKAIMKGVEKIRKRGRKRKTSVKKTAEKIQNTAEKIMKKRGPKKV